MSSTGKKRARKLLDEPSYFIEEYLLPDGEQVFDYQKDFMDTKSNRKLAVCGRQVGKSRMSAWIALHAAVTNPGHQIIITAKAQRQATELFNQIKTEIRKSSQTEDQWGIERSTRTEINFTNGSRIKVLPIGRDGSNIRGYSADMLIVDEAAFIQKHIFTEVLSPMLAVGDGSFILLSTPFGKQGYLYDRWDEATKEDLKTNDPKTDWYAMHVPSMANPLIDDAYIERQRNSLTKQEFQQEVLGEFVEDADGFFTRDELMNCAQSNPVQKNSSQTYLGADIASTGGDRSVYISIDSDGNIFHIESTEDTPLTDAMGRIRELDRQNDYDKIVIDATGLGQGVVDQVKESLGRKVEGFKFTNEKKQSLYNTLKNELQNGNLSYQFVSGSGEEENQMVSQCLSLEKSFTSTGKLKISHPTGGHDDYSDSLALAVWAKTRRVMARSDKESMKPFNLGSLR